LNNFYVWRKAAGFGWVAEQEIHDLHVPGVKMLPDHHAAHARSVKGDIPANHTHSG